MQYWLLIGLLLMVSGYLVYAWLDTADALSDARHNEALQQRTITLTLDLLRYTASGMSREALETMLTEHYAADHVVNKSADEIQVDDVVFVVAGGKVQDVRLLNEPGSVEGQHPRSR